MEIRTTDDLMERWRVLRGVPWRTIAQEARVSPTTLDKIRVGETVRSEKVAAVETTLGLPIGSIADFQNHGTIPDEQNKQTETQIETPLLKTGERLYEIHTEHGVRYRLESPEGHGASYTWPAPHSYDEIIPRLRKLNMIVATAGGLIDTE